jgi:hypothetical protein
MLKCLTTGGSIVFVHGLRGHRRNTWTKDGVCWPHDLLSQEEVLSHSRVLAFGYDANIVNPTGSASLNSLFEHSINLLNELARERKQDAVSLTIVREAIRIYLYLARPPHNLCCTFSRRAHSQRCMVPTPVSLSHFHLTHYPNRHSIFRIGYRTQNHISLKSSRQHAVSFSSALLTEGVGWPRSRML